MGELHRLADAAGRDPDGIGLIVLGVRANAVALDACRVAGAAAAAFELAPSGRDALRRLDRFAAMAAEHRGDRA